MQTPKDFLIDWLQTNTGLNTQSIYNLAKQVDEKYVQVFSLQKAELFTAVEFGYKQSEKGNNLQFAFLEFDKIISNKTKNSKNQTIMHADLKGALKQIDKSYRAFEHRGKIMTKEQVSTVLEYGINKGYKTTAEFTNEEVDKILGLQICYKTDEICDFECTGLCKESC